MKTAVVLIVGFVSLSGCMEAAPPEGYTLVKAPLPPEVAEFVPTNGAVVTRLVVKDGCYYIWDGAGRIDPYFTPDMAMASDYDGGPLCVEGR